MKILVIAISFLASTLYGSSSLATADGDVYNADGETEIKITVKTISSINETPDYKIIAAIPEIPNELPTYNVVPVDPWNINPKHDHIANIFDFTPLKAGEDISADGTISIMYTDASNRTIEYFSSGAVFYMEEQLFDERADDLLEPLNINREDAKKVFAEKAQSFLKKNDLAAPNMMLKDVSFADVSSISLKTQQETNKVVAAAVHFGYTLGGIHAWGPGAKTSLYFGAKGITGYYHAVPTLESAKVVKITPPDVALKNYMDADKAQSLYRLHAGIVEQVIIENVELVYYIDAGSSAQAVVAPQYLIQGTFYGRDTASKGAVSTKSEFLWLASAVSN